MLSPKQWRWIQKRVPIACVDVLPIRREVLAGGSRTTVGLIFRDTPHQRRRWCLIGGRLIRNESFASAIARELHEALGDGIRFEIEAEPQPIFVAQYFTESRSEGGHDPRQHAVGVTFCVVLSGAVRAQGEAIDFKWFDEAKLPAAHEFGFDQDRLVTSILKRLHNTMG